MLSGFCVVLNKIVEVFIKWLTWNIIIGDTVSRILKKAMFKEDYDEMVVVKNIELYSLCEHHMLPFFGKAHIAYLPDSKVVGISKIARLLDVYAKTQTQ